MEWPHDERADELERHADHLEEGSEQVGDVTKDTAEDWDSKKGGVDAPGATDPEGAAPGGLGEDEDEDEDEQDSGDESDESSDEDEDEQDSDDDGGESSDEDEDEQDSDDESGESSDEDEDEDEDDSD